MFFISACRIGIASIIANSFCGKSISSVRNFSVPSLPKSITVNNPVFIWYFLLSKSSFDTIIILRSRSLIPVTIYQTKLSVVALMKGVHHLQKLIFAFQCCSVVKLWSSLIEIQKFYKQSFYIYFRTYLNYIPLTRSVFTIS